MTQVSPADVVARTDDWVSRLNRLYEKLDAWLVSIPHDGVRRETLKQPVEPPMRQVKVSARGVPTYTILRGKHRVSFVPSALWLPGANGRVNVTTNTKQHVLVDRGAGQNGSNWQLVVDDFNRTLVPFTKAQFVRLLAEGE